MRKIRIGIDVDNVIADFSQGFIEEFNRITSKTLKREEITKWNLDMLIEELYKGEVDIEIVYYILTTPRLCQSLKLKDEYVYDTLTKLINDDKYEVIIITALDSELTDYRDKWFEEQFPNDKFNIIYTHNKDEVDIDYLIDDGLHNLDNLSKKIGNDRCICIDEPYNKSDKYPRFKSLKGAIDYIRGREG